jgi:hypothetical protein
MLATHSEGTNYAHRKSLWRARDLALFVTELSQPLSFIDDRCLSRFSKMHLAV